MYILQRATVAAAAAAYAGFGIIVDKLVNYLAAFVFIQSFHASMKVWVNLILVTIWNLMMCAST